MLRTSIALLEHFYETSQQPDGSLDNSIENKLIATFYKSMVSYIIDR